jgi:hypothetical protein
MRRVGSNSDFYRSEYKKRIYYHAGTDEARKHALLIAASILAARRLGHFGEDR